MLLLTTSLRGRLERAFVLQHPASILWTRPALASSMPSHKNSSVSPRGCSTLPLITLAEVDGGSAPSRVEIDSVTVSPPFEECRFDDVSLRGDQPKSFNVCYERSGTRSKPCFTIES